MKILNKYILFLGVLMVTPTLLFAQKKETNKKILSEKVEVTKDYIPTIGKASKRDITPTEEESMQIATPKLKYSIGYKPEKYPFKINYLEIPSYKMEQEPKLYNGYADIMVGGPLSSRANISYTTSPQRYMIAGIALSHKGFFGKLENKMGEKLSATQATNDLSLFFDYQKDNLKVKVSAAQNYDIYNRYGFNFPKLIIPNDFDVDKSLNQNYLRSAINLEIGTSFVDLNKFHTKFYGSFNTVSDKYKFHESIYQAGMLLSKRFEKINSLLEGRIEYVSVIPSKSFMLVNLVNEGDFPVEPNPSQSGDRFNDYGKQSASGLLSVAPRYKFSYKGFDLDLGVNLIFDFNGNDNNYKQGVTTVIPKAEISYSFLSGALKPYGRIDGEFINNNYSSLTRQNPYIAQGLTAPNSVIRRYMFGVQGIAGSSFYYNVHAGLRQSRDLMMFVNIQHGNIFSLMRDDFDNFEVGAEVCYILNSVFNANLDVQYIDYDNIGVTEQIAFGYAPFTATLGINVNPTKKLALALSGTFQSSRTFASIYAEFPEIATNKVSSVFDLSIGAEYKITNRFAVSLKGENLLNQKLYPFNNYRGIGLNVLAGISYKF